MEGVARPLPSLNEEGSGLMPETNVHIMIGEVRGALRGLERQLSDHAESSRSVFTRLGSKIETMGGQITATNHKVDSLVSKVDNVEAQVRSIRGVVSKVNRTERRLTWVIAVAVGCGALVWGIVEHLITNFGAHLLEKWF